MPDIDFIEFIVTQLERLADNNHRLFVKAFDNEKEMLTKVEDLSLRVSRLFAVNEKLTISSNESTPERLN